MLFYLRNSSFAKSRALVQKSFFYGVSWRALNNINCISKTMGLLTLLLLVHYDVSWRASNNMNYVSKTIGLKKLLLYLRNSSFSKSGIVVRSKSLTYVSKTIGFCRSCCFTYVIPALRGQEHLFDQKPRIM